MGPIVDRTKEHLSSGDLAVAQLRRMLLEAVLARRTRRRIASWAARRSLEPVRMPNAVEGVLKDDERWQDLILGQLP